jgi:hypothetical protein
MTEYQYEVLSKYENFWKVYKANKTMPNLSTDQLKEVDKIRRELVDYPAVNISCAVCIVEMFTQCFTRYEKHRELKQKDAIIMAVTPNNNEPRTIKRNRNKK